MPKTKRSKSSKPRPQKRAKSATPRPLKLDGDTVYQFKRTVALPAWYYSTLGVDTQYANNVINSRTNYYGYWKFALADLPNYTDFTNLFEAFRLKGVTLKFVPTRGLTQDITPQVTSANVEYSYALSPLALAAEKSAITSNPSFVSVLEDSDSRVVLSDRTHTMYIANPVMYQPGDGLTVTALATPWIDCAAGSAAHMFGAKFAFADISAAGTNMVAYQVFATYHLECRGVQ